MKNTILALGFLASIFAVSCNTHTNNQTDSSAVQASTVPYKTADRYFLKNEAKEYAAVKITSESDFNNQFGAAAVMGKNGMPTVIDFSKEFVVAVTGKLTNKNTDIVPVSLSKSGKNLYFKYRIKEGKEQSYTQLPSLILVVDKKYDGDLYGEIVK